MNAWELFKRYPEVAGVFGELREKNREGYRAACRLTLTRRKMRPAFLEKKPLAERFVWLAAEMGRATNEDLAAEVLQSWLTQCRNEMLVSFLDELGVPHDGKGLIESLPEEPPIERLNRAVALLLERWPRWEVLVYLNLFCKMDIACWSGLREITDRLTNTEVAATTEAAGS